MELVDYVPAADTKGETLDRYIDYFVTRDGNFIYPDLEDIKNWLLREHNEYEIAKYDDLIAVLKSECTSGARSFIDYCSVYWAEIPIEEVLDEYPI